MMSDDAQQEMAKDSGQLELLISEIRDKQNAADVAARIADETQFARKQGFGILMGLIRQFSNEESIVRELIEGCRNKWPLADCIAAGDLARSGNQDMANRIFPANIGDVSELSSGFIQKIVASGIAVGRFEQMHALIEVLFERADADSLRQAASLTYLCRDRDLLKEADAIWSRLFALDRYYRKEYLRYTNRADPELLAQFTPVDAKGANPRLTAEERRDEAKLIIQTEYRSTLTTICSQDIEKNADSTVINFWINIAYACASTYKDVLVANRIWQVILTRVPDEVNSFLRFSRTFNTMKANREIDGLIHHAHSLIGHAGRRRNDGRESLPLKRTAMSDVKMDETVEIQGIQRSMQTWLSNAGQFASARNYDQAIKIWNALLRVNRSVMPAVTRGLLRIALENPLDTFLSAMQIKETLHAIPSGAALFRSVAGNLSEQDPPKAERIFSALVREMPNDSGNRFSLSTFLLNQSHPEEAAGVWIPLQEQHASGCARCAVDLAKAGHNDLAVSLFSSVAQISPSCLLRHGYDYFREGGMNRHVCMCLQPLLPIGNETTLEEHQWLTLKLFLRYGPTAPQAKKILDQLMEAGALSRERSTIAMPAHSSKPNNVQQERDEEIEAYLEKHMPDLRRAGFFRMLMEKRPIFENTGKKTSRTTRSVLFHPERDMHSFEPTRRPKKKK